jgi:hypothetical protein
MRNFSPPVLVQGNRTQTTFGNRMQLTCGGKGTRFKATSFASRAKSIAEIFVGIRGLCLPAAAQVPGPGRSAKESQNPLELWDAVDYLLGTDQAKRVLPYLDRFMKSKPRNRYRRGPILTLCNNPSTWQFAKSVSEAIVVAAHKYATPSERIARFVAALTKTNPEQNHAVRRLRELGPNAARLFEAVCRQGLLAENQRQILKNIGRLDRSVVSALAVILDSPDPILVANAATALSVIGNKRAIPPLPFRAVWPAANPAVHAVSQAAIAHDLIGCAWALNDPLASLKAGSLRATISIFIYGPLNMPHQHPNLEQDYPGIRFLVQPVDAAMLNRQIKDSPPTLGDAERISYAREATLLVQIAKKRKGALPVDLTTSELALVADLNAVESGTAAATTSGDLRNPDAQRSLADLTLDPSGPSALRMQSATELVHSIRRLGRLFGDRQEARRIVMCRAEGNPDVQVNLGAITYVLRPTVRLAGLTQPPHAPVLIRIQTYIKSTRKPVALSEPGPTL